ncbi:YtpI family protein [Caldalkalibacillus mannanilyticus]|uniref:YtpI family protein n=1 Tax=Caldalkalibacillus mannanilyticus TaxID=1418 RepID=UPI000469CB64|nr:YtpI family protein [Caldalkalibacillus mannanilyticus]
MSIILSCIAAFSAGLSIFYSAKTRQYRKQRNYNVMKFYSAKVNISMGTMLLALGSIQLFTFGIELSGWRIFVGLLFLGLGLFNLLMGIRNYKASLPHLSEK